MSQNSEIEDKLTVLAVTDDEGDSFDVVFEIDDIPKSFVETWLDEAGPYVNEYW
jgi:hypothetical protein